MTTNPAPGRQDTLTIESEIRVKASMEKTFAALLDQLGPNFATPDGTSLHSKVEAWPGGRWYRDLGDHNGHFWANVQAIKRPTLLEFAGPLMMSQAVTNNVQYRLRQEGGETVIQFHHFACGLIPENFRSGMPDGWRLLLEAVRQRAER